MAFREQETLRTGYFLCCIWGSVRYFGSYLRCRQQPVIYWRKGEAIIYWLIATSGCLLAVRLPLAGYTLACSPLISGYITLVNLPLADRTRIQFIKWREAFSIVWPTRSDSSDMVFNKIRGVGNAREIDEFGRLVSDGLIVDNLRAVGTGHLDLLEVLWLEEGREQRKNSWPWRVRCKHH